MKWLLNYSAEVRPLLISFLSDSDCRNFVKMSAYVSLQEHVVHFFRGKCFYYGWGVEKDHQSAFSILEDVMKWACENYQDDMDAQWILGEIYELKMYGGNPIVAPRKLFEMAYRNGSVFGAYNLARKLDVVVGALDDALLCLECRKFCADVGFPNAVEKFRQTYCHLLARRKDLSERAWENHLEQFLKYFDDQGVSLLKLGRCCKHGKCALNGNAHAILKRAYSLGARQAAVDLCELHLRGSEFVNAEEWASRAAEAGEKDAVVVVATYYAARDFASRDDVITTDMLSKKLDALIALLPNNEVRKVSCMEVGKMYEKRWLTSNCDEPMVDCPALQFVKSWYMKAIEFGNASGCSAIGDLYFARMRYKEAEEWYNKDAENGGKPQFARLGAKYEGQGKIDDAVRCYELASRIEGPDRLLNVARLFNRRGISERAAEWYIRAKEAGSVDALWAIGNLHLYGKIFPLKKNLALNYFLSAANKGHVNAMKSVADFYIKERLANGLEPDYNAALMWYKKSAEGGCGRAWYELGQLQKNGRFCIKDQQAALECFKHAAKAKVRLAFYEVGQYYEAGQCVKRNEYEALRCYWYGWGLKSGKCEEELRRLIGHDRRLEYFVQRMAKGEERDQPSFLRDVQAVSGEEEHANRVELPPVADTRQDDGYYYVDGEPVLEANSQEEADIIYWNTH